MAPAPRWPGARLQVLSRCYTAEIEIDVAPFFCKRAGMEVYLYTVVCTCCFSSGRLDECVDCVWRLPIESGIKRQNDHASWHWQPGGVGTTDSGLRGLLY